MLWKEGITSACSHCLKNGELGHGCYMSPLSDGVPRSDRVLFLFYDFETAQNIKCSAPEVRELLQAAGVDLSRGGVIPEPRAFQLYLSEYRIVVTWFRQKCTAYCMAYGWRQLHSAQFF